MDTMRGNFGASDFPDESVGFDLGEDENIRDLPPAAIGQDERRMQVRAYNHWAGMLGDRNFPPVEELEPQNLDDFGPYSVLLDFSLGIEDPAIQYLGGKLAEECGADHAISKLSDVPSRSLLSRITDHYMQILANQAPIGFEAEFVNQRNATILYRGILLPFSSDNETIDFIYGVINWKEMADAAEADELLLQIDQALETNDEDEAMGEKVPLTLTEIAPANDEFEGPESEEASEKAPEETPAEIEMDTPANLGTAPRDDRDLDEGGDDAAMDDAWMQDDLPRISPNDDGDADYDFSLPTPAFGEYDLGEDEEEDEANYSFASLTDHVDLPSGKSKALDLDELGAQQAQNPEVFYEDGSFDPAQDIGQTLGDDQTPGDGHMPEYIGSDADIPASTPETEFDPEFDEDALGSSDDDADMVESAPITPILTSKNSAGKNAKPKRKPILTADEDYASDGGQAGGLAENQDEAELGQEELPEDAGLYDYLAAARELANVASDSEDRSRAALYAAVGRAFDVALAAEESPEEYQELLAENGLVAQERAPMTPVVKLVFGADYDKTRLTEYATVLGHARRIGLGHGQLQEFLSAAEGGLKGVVQAERRLRREEAGQEVEPVDAVRSALAKKLRELEPLQLTDLDPDGGEFGLVMIRRTEDGEIVVLGELEQDIPLLERSARKLLG